MPSRMPQGCTPIGELPEPEAWRILREVALPYHAPRLRASREVRSVALGVKEAEGRILKPREPCLKVHLYRKGHPSGDLIDPWKTVRTPQYGRVAFRTDIVDCGGASGNSSYAPSPFLEATESGSACCLLADGDSLYLLSAAHVLDGIDPLLSVSWSRAGFRFGWGQFVDNPETYWRSRHDDTAGDWGFVDAGLVAVQEPGLYSNPLAAPWGGQPVFWTELGTLNEVVIVGAYSRRVGAEWAGYRPTGDHVTIGSVDYKYWRVALFRFTDQRTTTVRGDSGSPVLSTDGRLVGMHVGTWTSRGVLYSMALCVGDLLELYRHLISPGLALYVPGEDG